ncbi:hypothetical protein LCGC14_2796830 [marine sediment metagenome]|uniref:Uncharacterized protein n=1 Tax=marine sediment metagenome TaxID=412755 RepID=A0A0F9BFB2_9ZZZZ
MINIQGSNKIKLAKESNRKKVFLGGTWNESKWRENLIKLLDNNKISWFDPIVKDWNEEAQKKEIKERNNSDYVLYVITPKMTGVYSIFEVSDDSNKRPEKTLFCYLEKDGDEKFNKGQIKSLDQMAEEIKKNGANVFKSLEEVAKFLNNKGN